MVPTFRKCTALRAPSSVTLPLSTVAYTTQWSPASILWFAAVHATIMPAISMRRLMPLKALIVVRVVHAMKPVRAQESMVISAPVRDAALQVGRGARQDRAAVGLGHLAPRSKQASKPLTETPLLASHRGGLRLRHPSPAPAPETCMHRRASRTHAPCRFRVSSRGPLEPVNLVKQP